MRAERVRGGKGETEAARQGGKYGGQKQRGRKGDRKGSGDGERREGGPDIAHGTGSTPSVAHSAWPRLRKMATEYGEARSLPRMQKRVEAHVLAPAAALVLVCACMHACVCVCMCACMHISIHLFVCVPIYACMHACKDIYIDI